MYLELERRIIVTSRRSYYISLYAGLTREEVFSKLMIFSPSLWIGEEIFEQARNFRPAQESQIFLYAGAKESQSLIPNLTVLHTSLQEYSQQHPHLLKVELSIDPEGNHSEYYWGRMFPNALRWLYEA